MQIFFLSLLALLGLYVLHQLVLAVLLVLQRDLPRLDYTRRISILVAARNEEDTIRDCLHSLHSLKYPPHLLDIHIGDDGSTDGTARIVQDFVADKPHFHYHYIDHALPGQRGKQNVLAHLAHHAQGELLLITDADVVHGRYWAALLAGGFKDRPRTGIVTAATLVKGEGAFAALQGLDWLTGISIMKGYCHLGLPISPVGNNMAVSREAYLATGGYEAIPFSITEDYKLWEAVQPHGYRMHWLMQPDALVVSRPMRSLGAFLQQRKRWFRGGQRGPWYAVASFALSALTHLSLAVAAFVLPLDIWLYLLLAKTLADAALLVAATTRLLQAQLLVWFLPYQLYLATNLIVYLLYFPLPGKVKWKGRVY